MNNNSQVELVKVINPSGGASYEAGTGIDISNDTISIDSTVVATKSDLTGINQVPDVGSGDTGKVLVVNNDLEPEWATPSGGIQYTEGTGIDISDQNVVSIDSTVVATKTDLADYQPELTAGSNISISNNTISATDTTYSAGSGINISAQNEISVDTTVVATQTDLTGIDQVPDVTSSDDGKVLAATYSGGVGSYSWVTPTDTTYSAGTGIDISAQNAISIDTTTVATKNDLPSSSDLVPSSSSGDAGKVLTVDALGEPAWVTPSGGTTYSAGDGIAIDGSNVVSADVDGTTIGIDSTTKKIKLLSTIPTVDQSYSAVSTNAQSGAAVAEAISGISVDEVPTVTSSDNGKVLKATYSGGQGSYAWGSDSDTTYTAGNMIAINANNSNAIGVSTTAGITDIQQVAALPANPVATVLYLIPET